MHMSRACKTPGTMLLKLLVYNCRLGTPLEGMHAGNSAGALRPIRCFAGYFKDKNDSYNGLYYLVAAASFFVSILWCLIAAADLIKALVLRRPVHQNAVVIPA